MPKFKDEYHPGVKRDLKKIDRSTNLEIKNFHIPKILNDPYNLEELKGDLTGIRSYHFKQDNVNYRISYSYLIDTENIVYILMIRKRENFYKILRRRF